VISPEPTQLSRGTLAVDAELTTRKDELIISNPRNKNAVILSRDNRLKITSPLIDRLNLVLKPHAKKGYLYGQ